MSMISFIFFGLVAVVFILLITVNKIFKDDRKAIKVANAILLVAFVIYADWKFAAVLAVLTLSTWFLQRKKAPVSTESLSLF